MIVFVVILITLLCLWLKYICDQRKYYALASKLAGPPAYPIIGCMLSFLGNLEDNFTKLLNVATRYTTPMCLWVGPKLYLYIDRPEQIQVILNSPFCLEKEKVYKFLEPILGDGLVTSDGAKWKYHRKLMNPCFGTTRLIGFMETFNEASKILTDRLESDAIQRDSVNIYSTLSDCTLDMVCKATMGVNLNLQKNENSEYLNASVIGGELVYYRIFNFWMHPQWIYKWTDNFKKVQNYSRILFSLPCSILRKRKEEIAKDEQLSASFLNELNEDECKKTPQIFINQLLKLKMQGHRLSDDDIQSEMGTMILAANETSAITVAFTVLALAFHPEIQERVYNETKEVFPTNDSKVEYEDFSKLIYLEMVLKETIRFYTTVPVIGRRTIGEVQLGDLTIPAGVGIFIGFHTLHRHKDIWGVDADEYNPDHFLPEAVEKRHPYSYLPFSGGPRNCIGQKYAMMSMKTMMVYLIRKYRFTTKLKLNELKYEIKITLKLINKYLVELHLREFPTQS